MFLKTMFPVSLSPVPDLPYFDSEIFFYLIKIILHVKGRVSSTRISIKEREYTFDFAKLRSITVEKIMDMRNSIFEYESRTGVKAPLNTNLGRLESSEEADIGLYEYLYDRNKKLVHMLIVVDILTKYRGVMSKFIDKNKIEHLDEWYCKLTGDVEPRSVPVLWILRNKMYAYVMLKYGREIENSKKFRNSSVCDRLSENKFQHCEEYFAEFRKIALDGEKELGNYEGFIGGIERMMHDMITMIL